MKIEELFEIEYPKTLLDKAKQKFLADLCIGCSFCDVLGIIRCRMGADVVDL